VAPDHQKIKSVTRVYEKIAANPAFRFFGNVTIGRDLARDELLEHYHAVIYAVGAQSDRALGVPGEHLPGSHAATEFVGWYNGHPDYRDHQFDLSQTSVAVIGMGNVAIDVVRILARTPDELHGTDIAEHALEALRHSQVRDIYMIGRRGPVQAAFTNPEIKELGELADANVDVRAEELVPGEGHRQVRGAVDRAEHGALADGHVAPAHAPVKADPRAARESCDGAARWPHGRASTRPAGDNPPSVSALLHGPPRHCVSHSGHPPRPGRQR
jgi:ferredoxin--NADP+ reductase